MSDKENMIRMQEDAMRRVREMQSRARNHLEHSRPELEPAPDPAPKANEKHPAVSPASSGDLLDTLLKDHERTLILALLVILGSEKAHPELLFALLFLLM